MIIIDLTDDETPSPLVTVDLTGSLIDCPICSSHADAIITNRHGDAISEGACSACADCWDSWLIAQEARDVDSVNCMCGKHTIPHRELRSVATDAVLRQ